jgi:hypothetical protein
MPGPGGDTLASVAETLAGLSAAARDGSLDDAAALAALSAVRQVTAELERGELALIEAARESGATWTRIAAATGARNRQTAQKRHADLARRHPCPPAVDTPAPQIPDAGHDHDIPEEKALVNQDALLKGTTRPPLGPANESGHARPPSAAGAPAALRKRTAAPKITDAVIAEGRYQLVRAPDHAETRAWRVLVGGRPAGLVRPTWRGERSRPGWEPVDLSGLALPVKGTGRVTPAGNARTRDAAVVCLLRALQCQQEQERKKAARRTTRPPVTPVKGPRGK